jgi:hypothetical protein
MGFVRPPFSQCDTDSARRKNPAAIILALRRSGDAKAVLSPEPLKQIDIALAPMAEPIILANHDMPNAKAAHQCLENKILRRNFTEAAREFLDKSEADALPGNPLIFKARGTERRRGPIWKEKPRGMGIKGQNRGRGPVRFGLGVGQSQNILVTAMNAVKLSDGDDSPARFIRKCGADPFDDPHGVPYGDCCCVIQPVAEFNSVPRFEETASRIAPTLNTKIERRCIAFAVSGIAPQQLFRLAPVRGPQKTR